MTVCPKCNTTLRSCTVDGMAATYCSTCHVTQSEPVVKAYTTPLKTFVEKREDTLAEALVMVGLPRPEREYRFAPPRRWRADIAYPERKVLIEVDGGIFTKGRHTRPQGFINDIEKRNEAQAMGYIVWVVPGHVDMLEAASEIATKLGGRIRGDGKQNGAAG